MNKVILIGRLTKDPELKFTPGVGTAVCTFTLAVDRIKKKDGTKEADFINVVAWNKAAEIIANYITKGRMLAIAGRLQTRNYDNKDGQKVYVTEVVAEDFQFVDSNGKQSNNGQAPAGGNSFNPDEYGTEVDSSEIPF